MTRRFTFIGVTTGQSSIMRVFPAWRDALGLDDVELVGCDIPINADIERYRAAVRRIKGDADELGALVTTHKIDILRAAPDLFDGLDDMAELSGEVSCIAHRSSRLLGWAKDPFTAGRSLVRFLSPDYFRRTGGEVLCFGAGGAGTAIALYFMMQRGEDRPGSIILTDRQPERLEHIRTLQERVRGGGPVAYVEAHDQTVHDDLMRSLAPGSVIINATGMGKDAPGSPITDRGIFPEGSIAWELNYRGDLAFYRQAQAQSAARRVRAVDGWDYFIFGWVAAMEEVFERKITAAEVAMLSRLAHFARPRSSPERIQS